MRGLLRRAFKLGIVVGAVSGLVVIGKKLMGGLGPPPGSDLAPKEWPSLVPDPVAPEASDVVADNGVSGSSSGSSPSGGSGTTESSGAASTSGIFERSDDAAATGTREPGAPTAD